MIDVDTNVPIEKVINIWLPADTYYRYFHKILKYQMVEPHGYKTTYEELTKNPAIKITNKKSGSGKFSHNFKHRAPPTWSLSETSLAISEAKQRFNNPLT